MSHADVLEKIHQIATMAGIKGQRQGELLSYGWDFGRGRDQMCFVAPFIETDEGLHLVCFFSPCERLGKGFLGGMSKNTALQLLRLNSQLEFGHFAIMKLGGDELLCVRTTQILETMEVQEFEQHCMGVAKLADAWEEKIGKNEF
jgi:hypothetical protein